MRADFIMPVLGAIGLVLYFAGQVLPAAIAVAVGVAVLVGSVITRR